MNILLRFVNKIKQIFNFKYANGGFIKRLTPDEQTKMPIYVSDCNVISKEMSDKLEAKFFEKLNNIKKYGENGGLVVGSSKPREFLADAEFIKNKLMVNVKIDSAGNIGIGGASCTQPDSIFGNRK
jgi:hypothetical protein